MRVSYVNLSIRCDMLRCNVHIRLSLRQWDRVNRFTSVKDGTKFDVRSLGPGVDSEAMKIFPLGSLTVNSSKYQLEQDLDLT